MRIDHRAAAAALAAALVACGGGAGGRTDSAAGVVDTTAMAPAPASAAGATTAQAPNTQMQAVLDELASLGGQPIETLAPAEARKQPTPADAATKLMTDKHVEAPKLAVTSADRMIAGAAGQIPARVYTPQGAGPFPVVVYYHGGGWVIANKQVYDGGARALSAAAKAVVVSVDYRQAPEHKFPAAHDDALAAYRWALANAASIGGDPARIALAGESAGGNLAVATAVAARDAKLPRPAAVIAVYPIAQADTTTSSYTTYANAKPLSRPMMSWFARQTTRTPADLQDPRISLVKANLAGLPPVTIVNAEIDPLRDDGAQLERALKAANVAVERKVYDGVTHEFFGMGAVLDAARDANRYAGDRLKAAFGG